MGKSEVLDTCDKSNNLCELQYCNSCYTLVADKTVASCFDDLRYEVQTVVVSWRCLPSESVNENAAVITPPVDSRPASKTSDTTMAHLMRDCEPCMSGLLTLILLDALQALVADSSTIV